MSNTTNTPQATTAAVAIPGRKIFQPYFRARWQNMQNLVNDSAFLSQVPARFLTYYNTYINQWLNWSRGFVPQLHQQDFFATGIGYTVCDIYARECMSGGWRIDSKDEATARFFENWGNERLGTLFDEMFFHSNAGGNALLCLTPVDGDIYPSVLGVNRFIFDIGRSGKISHAIIYNRFSTGDDSYYALETRLMCDGGGYYIVQLEKGSGNILSPTWTATTGLPKIPLEVAQQWQYCYGDIQPNTWYKLPSSIGLGVFNVKNKSVAVAISDLPGYSDSTLHTALDVLYSIDFNYTQQQLDMYWGRTRVLLPKEMQAKGVGVRGGVGRLHESTVIDTFDVQPSPLQDDIYCKIADQASLDGKPIQPEWLQPDLRGESHKYIRDADLELLASKIGLSSSTLANHLSYTQSKTATQVVAEQDTTEISVNNKRSLASVAINAMLKAVAKFYGLSDDVKIVWNRYGVNSPQENATLLSEVQAGLMTKREYLKRRFSDLTEKQIDEWLEELKNEESTILTDYRLGGF